MPAQIIYLRVLYILDVGKAAGAVFRISSVTGYNRPEAAVHDYWPALLEPVKLETITAAKHPVKNNGGKLKKNGEDPRTKST